MAILYFKTARVARGGEARPRRATYQISRWRCSGFRRRGGGIAPAFGKATTREVFVKMSEGRFAIFVIKGASPSNLGVAEILKKDEELAKV